MRKEEKKWEREEKKEKKEKDGRREVHRGSETEEQREGK